MSIEEHKNHIENVIELTFEIIKKVYKNQQEKDGLKGDSCGSRIIFPKKRGKKDKDGNAINLPETRVSEQELRFIFVEQLIEEIGENGKNWNVYYSVETPTEKEYGFTDPTNKESGNIDLVIHDSNFDRIALIEFKAKNPKLTNYQKDFEKLTNEPKAPLRYFIQILEGTKSNTITNIEKEKVEVKEEIIKRWGNECVYFICYSLSSEKALINKIVTK